MPAAIPIGVPITIAATLIMRLPNSAFAMPPSAPGGGVIWVNNSGFIAARPLRSVVHRIQTSQNRPKPAESADSRIAIAFLMRRLR